MKPSKHALERWAQRFPGQNMQAEFAKARITSDAENQEILKRCPRQRYKRIEANKNYYYKITQAAVFVMGGKHQHILTVFPRSF